MRAFCLAGVLLLSAGCATHEKWIDSRPAGESFTSRLLWFDSEPEPLSAATLEVAGPSGLNPANPTQRVQLLALLQQESAAASSPALEFAISELSAREADRLAESEPEMAIGFYAESLVHGYRALEGDRYQRVAGTTQRYNESLESLLRVLRARDLVKPGAVVPLPLARSACSIEIRLHSQRWTEADFQGFEFADDFQVMGLRNHYHNSGVGVPLIGIRFHPDRDHPEDRFYPRKLCYPLTAVVRAEAYEHTPPAVAATDPPPAPIRGVRLVLELHDPMDHETLRLSGKPAPLQTDLTTPLAYYLDQPELHEEEVSTLGLLQPESVEQMQGLYLLEPFDPNRIPVVMVHGLWSSPATWMEMFNDLRSDPVLRSRYQFWFYLYPTGTPFWVNAARLRGDIRGVRETFDPERRVRALDQTVLVGHSMGGLLSRLQTVSSEDHFWGIVSERRFDELDADPETRAYLSNLFYFQPDPSVQRVVTIGTPHRGSRFANGFTQWLGAKLISVPMQTMAKRQELFRRNPDFFRPQVAARVMTSIDSLSPASPMLTALLNARPGPWVKYHNVVGDVPRTGVSRWVGSRGDGIVSVDSAQLDDLPQLASQIVVPEDHVALHRHPQSIAEVRRVLYEQLTELQPTHAAERGPAMPGGRRLPPPLPTAGGGQAVRLASGVAQ